MKNFIVLLFAAIAITSTEADIPVVGGLLGNGGVLSGNGLGGGLLGQGGATSIIAQENGITSGLLNGAGAIVDLGGILGLRNTKCLQRCPLQIVDTKLKCVRATTFPGYPICYGQNTRMKFIWPCQEKKNR